MRLPSRRKLLRARLGPLYLLVLALFVLADPAPLGLALGAILVTGGLALRAWGAGHLVKTDQLVTSGPYAHLRHPLYSGTLLVAAGFAAAAGTVGWVLMLGVVLPLFFFYYLPYKDRIESARLEGRYGEAFSAYRRAVPALWPMLAAWRPADDAADHVAGNGPGADDPRCWRAARYLDNDEHGTLVASLVGLALLALRPALPF